MRFFRGGMQKPELDTDRVLKNELTSDQIEYIMDNILTFNDNQLLRCLYLLKNSHSAKFLQVKDKILRQIQSSLRTGRFEVKKGNTLATLAIVMNANHHTWYGYSKDILLESQATNKMHVGNIWLSLPGTYVPLQKLYTTWMNLA